MRRVLIFTVSILFVVALLSRTMTYTVRFTEKAVKTTFGSADENDVQSEPGLKWKWPDPIQSVTKYDTRVRYLQGQSETQQTADDRQLVVEAFCTWRVENPLHFFRRFSNAGDRAVDHYRAAGDVLKSNLRSALSETSKYRMDELFTADAAASKLPDLEAKILATLRATIPAESGVQVVEVGIARIVLPQDTTTAVFDTMRADRARLVKQLESKGDAEAQRITGDAMGAASKIESFAKAYAAEIRQQGELEATQFVKQMNENPELAVFLKNIEFIREALAKRVTLIFDTNMPGFELFSLGAMGRKAGQGSVPGVGALMGIAGSTPGEAPSPPAGSTGGHGDGGQR